MYVFFHLGKGWGCYVYFIFFTWERGGVAMCMFCFVFTGERVGLLCVRFFTGKRDGVALCDFSLGKGMGSLCVIFHWGERDGVALCDFSPGKGVGLLCVCCCFYRRKGWGCYVYVVVFYRRKGWGCCVCFFSGERGGVAMFFCFLCVFFSLGKGVRLLCVWGFVFF